MRRGRLEESITPDGKRDSSLAFGVMCLSRDWWEKFRALHTEEVFNGLFGFSIASKAPSGGSSKPETDESRLVRDQNCDIGAPNQELQYGFAMPSPSVVSYCHTATERQI
ncbi:hypothetical protein TNCV_4943131 [Trichonephila clavipes]|nr:hypothetical protein TNCV_4943131 [Trichonephila clavipes]